jgi:transposase
MPAASRVSLLPTARSCSALLLSFLRAVSALAPKARCRAAQEHKAGEKVFVDWAGDTIPIYDARGGPVQRAHLFVAVLEASSYTYAEVTPDEQLASWIGAHVRAFEFFSGNAEARGPGERQDRGYESLPLRSRSESDLPGDGHALRRGGVVPARPYKPRDKTKAESGVLLAERWIIAALRHRKCFSIEELNQAIRELRDCINQRPFRKREGSRASQFMAVDKPALNPLPAEPFDLSQWCRARVNIDYHIAFDTNYYSVPCSLVQELVEVRSTPTTIEIFHESQRVASHLRAHGHGHAVTIAEHRPRSHQAHLEWIPSRLVHWAKTIGPHTARLFERILADKPHPEMGYRSCLGIIRLADQYSPARVEAAAERALLTGACSYQSVKSILKNSLDVIPPSTPPPSSPPPPHDNIRGAEYFE